DDDDEFYLSDIAKKYIAGLLRHSREICSVLAQWVNSYKRLVPGYEAPVYIAWSHRNRSALVRVPAIKPGKQSAARVELRCPDPACNPYLAFSVMLAAGLAGIDNGYELPPPMEKNLYELTESERRALGIQSLPASLGEALAETEKSELVRKALGDHVFERFVELKSMEWHEFCTRVTEWEVNKYLPIL
ncbi:MAG: glutamine synthetase, partial [Armatimonadetes bacterium]|nr:glutamine synthetase [Armatimonadota bacterium]